MGTTTKYGLPWPANSGLVRDGAAAIRALAENAESILLPPLLATTGDGAVAWTNGPGNGDGWSDGPVGHGEIPWDVTDDPARKRGGWTSAGANEKLVIPALTGYYLVTATVRLGGLTTNAVLELGINTRAQGSEVASGTRWATQRTELAESSDTYAQLAVSAIVPVNAGQGIATRVYYSGWSAAPTSPAGANRLQIVRLSAL